MIPEQESIPNTWISFFDPSSRRKALGSAWGSPSAGRLWKRTAGACGRHRKRDKAQLSNSRCPSVRPIEMAEQDPIVYIVDDDVAVRNAMDSAIGSLNLRARPFVSPDEFILANLPYVPGCLVLDVRMPGRSGIDLQSELLRLDNPIPIIFISGHGDVPMAVRVMKAGAGEFLLKPF